MKGLILHTFYTNSVNEHYLGGFFMGLFFFAASSSLPSMYILCAIFIASFVCSTGSRLQAEQLSGWTQYERTLPVSKSNIILAKYLGYLLLLFRGIISCLLILAIMKLIGRTFTLSYVAVPLLLSSAFALLVGAFIHPMHLLHKHADSSELLVRSLCIPAIIFIFFFGSQKLRSASVSLHDFDFVIPVTIAGVLFFILSFFFSLLCYERSES